MPLKKFSLPGFNLKAQWMMDFLRYRSRHPQYFYPDRIIDSSYDANYQLIWSGGREPLEVIPHYHIHGLLKDYRDNFPYLQLRFVFTNRLITEELTHDYLCNRFVQDCVTPKDKVILNSPALIQYFMETYPDIDFIFSTTLEVKDLRLVNKLSEYHIYVLNYQCNLDDEYIKTLEHKENIEILVGEPCFEHCTHRNDHQTRISEMYLGHDVSLYHCPYGDKKFLTSDVMSRETFVSNDRVDELAEMGIQYFKISGRAIAVPAWLYIMTYYLVLPEYRDLVREELLVEWW